MIKDNVKNLKEMDTYSLLLFALYKFTDAPEYSSLSELAYVLDKQNLLNLCEYFGGQTIKIPTTAELQTLVQSLLLYQYVKIDGMEYDEAIRILGFKSYELRDVKKNYSALCDILDNYNFIPRSSVKTSEELF